MRYQEVERGMERRLFVRGVSDLVEPFLNMYFVIIPFFYAGDAFSLLCGSF